MPHAGSLRQVLARFQDPLPHVATWQIATTIVPLIALLVAMRGGLAFGLWPLLALGMPAAALTVRTFIILTIAAMDLSTARAVPTTSSGVSARY